MSPNYLSIDGATVLSQSTVNSNICSLNCSSSGSKGHCMKFSAVGDDDDVAVVVVVEVAGGGAVAVVVVVIGEGGRGEFRIPVLR